MPIYEGRRWRAAATWPQRGNTSTEGARAGFTDAGNRQWAGGSLAAPYIAAGDEPAYQWPPPAGYPEGSRYVRTGFNTSNPDVILVSTRASRPIRDLHPGTAPSIGFTHPNARIRLSRGTAAVIVQLPTAQWTHAGSGWYYTTIPAPAHGLGSPSTTEPLWIEVLYPLDALYRTGDRWQLTFPTAFGPENWGASEGRIGTTSTTSAGGFTATTISNAPPWQERLTLTAFGEVITTNWVGLRVPLAAKSNLAAWRLHESRLGTNYPATSWTHVVDDATYAYYTVQPVLRGLDSYSVQTRTRQPLAPIDITDDVESYDLKIGNPVPSDGDVLQIRISAARGELVLRNPLGKYSADSANAINSTHLRRKLGIKLVDINANTLWDGEADPPEVIAKSDDESFAKFNLTGRIRDDLNRQPYRLYADGTQLRTILTDLISDIGADAGAITMPSIPTGTAVVGGSGAARNLGTFAGQSNAATVLRQIATMAGALIFEDEQGRIACLSVFELDRTTTESISDAAFHIYAEGTFVGDDSRGVYNTLTARELSVTPDAASTLLTTLRIPVAASTTITRTVDVPRTVSGAVTFSAAAASTSTAGITASVASTTSDKIAVSIENTTAAVVTAVVDVRATIHRVALVEEEVIERLTSIDEYGRRPVPAAPDWYEQGSITFANRLMNRLESPLLIARLRCPRWQPSKASRDALDGYRPGDLVQLSLAGEQGITASKTMAVSSLEYSWAGVPSVPQIEVGLVEVYSELDARVWILGQSILGTNTVLT